MILYFTLSNVSPPQPDTHSHLHRGPNYPQQVSPVPEVQTCPGHLCFCDLSPLTNTSFDVLRQASYELPLHLAIGFMLALTGISLELELFICKSVYFTKLCSWSTDSAIYFLCIVSP